MHSDLLYIIAFSLSIRVNLLVFSAVIFADEPTSGLDSFQAERVAQILKTLAEEGNTVIASIHQPRASVYALFDEITLMSEGRVVYSGPTSTVASFFAAQGFPCPNNISPPEFYVDLISVDYSSPEAEEASKRRIFQLADAMTASQKQQQPSTSSSVAEDIPVAVSESYSTGRSGSQSLLSKLRTSLRKFSLLYQRAWRNVSRDKSLFIARFASNIFSALLFGAIYFRLGDGASTVPDRLGLLQVAAVNTAMTSLIKATTTFVTEKLIVQRERRSEAYAVTPYFVSKLLAEAPISAFFPCLAGGLMYKLCGLNPAPGRLVRFISILVVESFTSSALGMAVGSLASSVESAVAIAPSVMVIFIVFGGLYVVNTPSYLAWVPKVSLIRWAYEALCVNEFSDLKFKPEARMGPLAVTKGEQVLESMGMGKSTVKKALISQASIMLANYLFTIVSLVLQKPSFEKIKPRPIADSSQASTNGISIKTPMKPF